MEFRSEPRLLCAVRSLVRTYIVDRGIPEERAQEVVLAVDEACTNAIRHSYDGRRDGTLVLALRSNEAWIEIELRDEGHTAPPEKVRPRPQSSAPADASQVQPGGLGVQLIYDIFDEVSFAPGEHEGNCVTMRLKRPGA